MIEVIVRYLLEKSSKVSSVQSPHPSTIRCHLQHSTHDYTIHFQYQHNRGDVSSLVGQSPFDDTVITGEHHQPYNKRGKPPIPSGGENPPITPKKPTVVISSNGAGADRQRSFSLGGSSTTQTTSFKRGRGMEWKQHGFRPRNMVELEWDQKQAAEVEMKMETNSFMPGYCIHVKLWTSLYKPN